jgi:hypothetical protein
METLAARIMLTFDGWRGKTFPQGSLATSSIAALGNQWRNAAVSAYAWASNHN